MNVRAVYYLTFLGTEEMRDIEILVGNLIGKDLNAKLTHSGEDKMDITRIGFQYEN
jgi:hypothetical protein